MKKKDMPSMRAKKLAITANNRVANLIRSGAYHPSATHRLVFDAFMAGYRHMKKLEKAK